MERGACNRQVACLCPVALGLDSLESHHNTPRHATPRHATQHHTTSLTSCFVVATLPVCTTRAKLLHQCTAWLYTDANLFMQAGWYIDLLCSIQTRKPWTSPSKGVAHSPCKRVSAHHLGIDKQQQQQQQQQKQQQQQQQQRQ